ncbi:LPXTG cell wall anchor domain-containing protein [Candidatus Gracilibacteria bacterium]|nr:LPXTG cell wall anchor domain-containing protein [Candidatus Gracilibacteria bacterium]
MIYYIPTNIPSGGGEYDLILSAIGIIIVMVGFYFVRKKKVDK